MAVIFSVPTYVPDPTSIETVTGYQVQSSAPTTGVPLFTGTWTDITGSPFSSPNNIVDAAGTINTQYRVRPVRVASSQTLDTPWSRPFLPGDSLYDAMLTRVLLPTLRFTYLGDQGIPQSNGTVVGENTGAGQGTWVLDGSTKRFQLQYVPNDNPIKLLDSVFTMVHKNSGGTVLSAVVDQDYSVDVRNGAVEFATAPGATDYIRFDFRQVDMVNQDVLQSLVSAVNALSQFGINGYQFNRENNLLFLNTVLPNPDIVEIICKLAIFLMREGQTEAALRNTTAWRDGSVSSDPFPSRALEFLVQKLNLSEKSIQRTANAYIRAQTKPLARGDFDVQFDMTQLTPVSMSLFRTVSGYTGFGGAGGFFYPWWL